MVGLEHVFVHGLIFELVSAVVEEPHLAQGLLRHYNEASVVAKLCSGFHGEEKVPASEPADEAEGQLHGEGHAGKLTHLPGRHAPSAVQYIARRVEKPAKSRH